MDLIEMEIPGIEGTVLVKKITVNKNIWNLLYSVENPFRNNGFNIILNEIEIPLNDFYNESDYGDVSFFADEINSALSDGAELLLVKKS